MYAPIRSNMHNLKAVRQHRGFSQQQLARAAQVSQAHISQVESGMRAGVDVAFILAHILGVSVDDLYRADRTCDFCGMPSAKASQDGGPCADCTAAFQEMRGQRETA